MKGVSFFVKFAIVLFILSIISMIIVEKYTVEFYLSLTAFILSLLIVIIGIIIIRVRKE